MDEAEPTSRRQKLIIRNVLRRALSYNEEKNAAWYEELKIKLDAVPGARLDAKAWRQRIERENASTAQPDFTQRPFEQPAPESAPKPAAPEPSLPISIPIETFMRLSIKSSSLDLSVTGSKETHLYSLPGPSTLRFLQLPAPVPSSSAANRVDTSTSVLHQLTLPSTLQLAPFEGPSTSKQNFRISAVKKVASPPLTRATTLSQKPRFCGPVEPFQSTIIRLPFPELSTSTFVHLMGPLGGTLFSIPVPSSLSFMHSLHPQPTFDMSGNIVMRQSSSIMLELPGSDTSLTHIPGPSDELMEYLQRPKFHYIEPPPILNPNQDRPGLPAAHGKLTMIPELTPEMEELMNGSNRPSTPDPLKSKQVVFGPLLRETYPGSRKYQIKGYRPKVIEHNIVRILTGDKVLYGLWSYPPSKYDNPASRVEILSNLLIQPPWVLQRGPRLPSPLRKDADLAVAMAMANISQRTRSKASKTATATRGTEDGGEAGATGTGNISATSSPVKKKKKVPDSENDFS